MTSLSIRLLGPPAILLENEPVHIGRRKALALMAYLALNPQPQSRAALAELLWPAYDAASARAELRRALSTLTRAIGAHWFQIDRQTIMLTPAALHQVDVNQFQQLLDRFRTGNGTDLALLARAIDLAAADFLAGLAIDDAPDFEQWQLFEGQAFQRDLGWALERYTHGLHVQGATRAALAVAERWRQLDALHEPPRQWLMQLHAELGATQEALREYQTYTELLQQEMGLTPSSACTQLYQQIRSGQWQTPLSPTADPKTAAQTAPATSSKSAQVHLHLPAQLVAFVGRKHELNEVAALLADPHCRLITLTGPGGIGKTQLALQVAQQAAYTLPTAQAANVRWPDGVYFVDLSAMQEGELLASTMADALALAAGAQVESELVDYLHSKRLLLILDNMEQLLHGETTTSVLALLNRLLQQAAHIKMIVTSRQRLNLHGESVFSLVGMPFPAADDFQAAHYDAVQLFVQSARRANQHFALTAANRADVVHICQLVQGTPLALDLAASWSRLLSCQEIAREIVQSLAFLESAAANLPSRHRSMLAVFEHSWRLLTPTEQRMFAEMSRFGGGFTRHAAAAVAGATLPTLARLIDKSLVRPVADARYSVHELLRQCAAAKLSAPEAAAVAGRHGRYYCQLLAESQWTLQSARRISVGKTLQSEADNLRLAWEWAVATMAIAEMNDALHALYLFFLEVQNSFAEAVLRFEHAASAVAAHAALQARRQDQQGQEEANLLLARLWARAGIARLFMGQAESAEALMQRSLAQLRALHADAQSQAKAAIKTAVEAEIAFVLARLCLAHSWRGDFENALPMIEESVALHRRLDLPAGLDTALAHLAYVLQDAELFDQAETPSTESLALARQLGDPDSLMTTLTNLGTNYLYQKRPATALPLLEEALAVSKQSGNRSRMAISYSNMMDVLLLLEHHAAARQHGEQALALFDELGQRQYRAHTRITLGKLDLAINQPESARQQFMTALKTAVDLDIDFIKLGALSGLAHICAHQGAAEQAVELCSLVIQHPAALFEHKEPCEQLRSALQATLDAMRFEAASRNGQTQVLDHISTHFLNNSMLIG
ncbi:MAG: tetratricopeptide repeat protein [Caldilineaceae bacterium]|nr:tetratricopeptide repeat protein [Caldilineaceae bacterium]